MFFLLQAACTKGFSIKKILFVFDQRNTFKAIYKTFVTKILLKPLHAKNFGTLIMTIQA